MLKLQKFISIHLSLDCITEFLDFHDYLEEDCFLKIYSPRTGESESANVEDLKTQSAIFRDECRKIEKLSKDNGDPNRIVYSVIPTVLCIIDIYSRLSSSFIRICVDYEFDPENDKRFGLEIYYVSNEEEEMLLLPLKYPMKIEKALEVIPKDLKLLLISNLHIF
jgi:hypothetical protein